LAQIDGAGGTLGSGGDGGSVGGTGGKADESTAGGTGGQTGMGGQAGMGCDADTESDVHNCGACGSECVVNGAYPLCVDGRCTFEACLPTRYDANGAPEDGCEAVCVVSNDGVEICDGIDNDCDFEIDEDFDLTRVDQCGGCNTSCDVPNATPECVEANGWYTCHIAECDAGWRDFDGVRTNGCELNCEESHEPACN